MVNNPEKNFKVSLAHSSTRIALVALRQYQETGNKVFLEFYEDFINRKNELIREVAALEN